jgi:hypothetical protein
MTDLTILIRGIPEKLPQITKKGDAILVFKTMENNQTYCMVHVKKELWSTVFKEIEDTTYFIIEGTPMTNITPKKIPFISVFCKSIHAINGLTKDESTEGQFNFLGKLPFDTSELIPITDINILKTMQKPKTALERALKYFKAHKTFSKPIIVRKSDMNLISGYENYLLAKDLGIAMVPVSYNYTQGAPSKDEIGFGDTPWHTSEEIVEVNVKDIIITENIHLNVQNFTFSINIKGLSKTKTIDTPIAIRPLENGKYSVVAGIVRYFAAKILDIEKIPAVITNMSHDEFIKSKYAEFDKNENSNDNKDTDKKSMPKINKKLEGTTPILDITIPAHFARTKPKSEKIRETIEYYEKHGKFDKPVIIKGESNLLVDGYKRYLAAKELGHDSVWSIKYQ